MNFGAEAEDDDEDSDEDTDDDDDDDDDEGEKQMKQTVAKMTGAGKSVSSSNESTMNIY
jgi:hypothetical protein